MLTPILLLKIAYTLIAFSVILVAFFLLGLASHRLLRVRLERQHVIRLENRGNCRSLYYLSVSSSEPSLGFTLRNGKIDLVALPDEAGNETTSSPPTSPGARADLSSAAVKANHATPQQTAVSAAKTGKAAAAKAGTLASLLGALGRILPGSLGVRLRANAAAAREMQLQTNRAIQAPQTAQNQVNDVQREGNKLLGAKAPAPRLVAGQSQPAKRQATATGSGWGGALQNDEKPRNAIYRAQSPEMEPGTSLDLSLVISAKTKRFPCGSFAYTLESQPIALDFPEAHGQAEQRSGVVHFPPVPGWRYWLHHLAIFLLIALAVFAFGYAFLLIWQ